MSRSLRAFRFAVGRGFLGFAAEGAGDRIDERHELAVVAHARSQLMGYNDLGRPIDGSLGVEALDVAILGQQHPALWIGEVALRFARGLPVRVGLSHVSEK